MGNIIYMARTISILSEEDFKKVQKTPIHLVEQKTISTLETYFIIKEEKENE